MQDAKYEELKLRLAAIKKEEENKEEDKVIDE
jgi:hypothetical protein